MKYHKSITPELLESIQSGIQGWQAYIDSEKRALELGVRCDRDVVAVNIDAAERTLKAFDIELKTGVAVCSCCYKPFGRGTLKHAN